jgi:hypothetical protein
MASGRFHSARLKIDRANKHISELQTCLDEFLKTDFYILTEKKNAERGEHGFTITLLKPIPDEVALIAGDAIHNLRTALDFMFGEAVQNRGFHFPAMDSRKKLAKAVQHGVINQFPKVAAVLLNVIEPHPTWYDSIWTLHRLDVADKHQLLIPVMGLASASADFEDSTGKKYGGISSGTVGGALGESQTVMGSGIAPWNSTLKFQNDGKPTFRVLFGEGLPAYNEPVLPTLHQFSELVCETVNLFESHCF